MKKSFFSILNTPFFCLNPSNINWISDERLFYDKIFTMFLFHNSNMNPNPGKIILRIDSLNAILQTSTEVFT